MRIFHAFGCLNVNRRGAQAEVLDRFRSRVSAGRLVAYWSDEVDLCLKLVELIGNHDRQDPRSGWVRGGDTDPEALLKKLVDAEEANSKLRAELDHYVSAPLVDHVQRFLKAQSINIEYIINSTPDRQPGMEEKTTKEDRVNLYEISKYALPLMNYNKDRGLYSDIRFADTWVILMNLALENGAGSFLASLKIALIEYYPQWPRPDWWS